VVPAGLSVAVAETPSIAAPGKSGIVGLIMPISVLTGASGLEYMLPIGEWRLCCMVLTISVGMYACASVVMKPMDALVSYGWRAFILTWF